MKKGAYCGAMLSVADLKKRCKVHYKTQCWEWLGATDSAGAPSPWVRAIGERSSMGVLIAVLTTGKRPEKGRRWFVTCDTKNCANPKHRREGSIGDAVREMRKHGPRTFSMLARSRISVSRRQGPTKLNEGIAREIRASDESQSTLALRYGVTKSTIGHVQAGRAWRELGGSSVFTFRP
jgi:hypothetical protein